MTAQQRDHVAIVMEDRAAYRLVDWSVEGNVLTAALESMGVAPSPD